MVEINAYSLKKDGDKYLTKNFRVREFACSDGTDVVFVAPALVKILQQVRDHFKVPVTVNSGYRTVSHNKKVGGATYSQHLYGMAADIVVKEINPKTVYAYVESLLPGTGGVGLYSSFVHVDCRETKSRWKG